MQKTLFAALAIALCASCADKGDQFSPIEQPDLDNPDHIIYRVHTPAFYDEDRKTIYLADDVDIKNGKAWLDTYLPDGSPNLNFKNGHYHHYNPMALHFYRANADSIALEYPQVKNGELLHPFIAAKYYKDWVADGKAVYIDSARNAVLRYKREQYNANN